MTISTLLYNVSLQYYIISIDIIVYMYVFLYYIPCTYNSFFLFHLYRNRALYTKKNFSLLASCFKNTIQCFYRMNLFFDSRIPENTVQYVLFPSVDPTLNCEDVKEKLDDLIVQYTSDLAPFLTDYIFHKESFILRPIINDNGILLGVFFISIF